MIRKTYLSGTWYPSNNTKCLSTINSYIKKYKIKDKNLLYKIGVVPHAGWTFSGQLAAKVIYTLSEKSNPDVVILIGGHLSVNDKTYIMEKCEVETPFGNMHNIDDYHNELLNGIDYKIENAGNYEPDNTTELQLPFIKYFFETNKIIILRIPPNNSYKQIAENINKLNNKNIVIICSTDLTHYGYRFNFLPAGIGQSAIDWVKTKNDVGIISNLIKLNSEKILKESIINKSACCGGSIALAAELGKKMHAEKADIIDYYTSADILKEKNSTDFVSYIGAVI